MSLRIDIQACRRGGQRPQQHGQQYKAEADASHGQELHKHGKHADHRRERCQQQVYTHGHIYLVPDVGDLRERPKPLVADDCGDAAVLA